MVRDRQKFEEIHALRGVSIFFIVLMHLTIFPEPVGGSLLYDTYKALISEWTTVFLLISGFLFSHLTHKYNYPEFLKSKFLYVVIPYLVLTLPAALIYILGFKGDHLWVDIAALRSSNIFYQLGFFYVTGAHLGPMWYIPTLILIFLASPIAYVLGKHKSILYLLTPVLIVAVLLTQRPPNNSNALVAFLHFFPVFILGMTTHRLATEAPKEVWRTLLMVCSVVFVAAFIYSMKVENSAYSVQKIFAFPLLVELFRHLRPGVFKTHVDRVAHFSFSIYFVHGYAAFLIKKLDPFTEQNLILNILIAVAVSVILIYIIIGMFMAASRMLGTYGRPILGVSKAS